MQEMRPEMGDVLEEERLVTHADVIEKHEVLVKLSHVPHMGNDGAVSYTHLTLPTNREV